MSAQVTITQLPAAGAITGTESVPIVQNGQTVRTTTGAIAASPSQPYQYLTVVQTPQLANSRALSGGTGIGLVDGGAQSTLQITLNAVSGSLETASNGIIAKSGSAVVARTLTASGNGLSITDGNGVSGNPTFALSGVAASVAGLSGTGMLAMTGGGTTVSGRDLLGTANQITITNGNGASGNPTFAITTNPELPGVEGVTLPYGTTAERAAIPNNGELRYNTTTATFEGYANNAWGAIVTGTGVTSVATGTGLTGGPITSTGTISLANTAVTAGTYGSSSVVPVIAVNAQGQITSATNTTINAVTLTTGTISTTPSGSTDIANKSYVDTVAQGLDTKASVVAGTTANITLSGAQTIDGVAVVATDRVLVKNQTAPADNGIYIASATAWSRAPDMNTWVQVPGAYVFIEGGTTLADTGWVCTSDAGGTIGVTAITWAQFSGAGSGVSSITFGSTGLTPSTATNGAITVAGTLAVTNGGTGQTTASAAFNALSPITTTGDLILGNGTNSATRLGIGANGYLLTSNGTTASWVAAPAGGVTSFAGGTTGLTPASATTGAITLAGTLAVANGGTGRTVGNYSIYANEIHVGKDGNDTTGDGTLINPVLTITKALTLIGAGRNTVIVHPGSYSESPTVSSANTTIETTELTGANTQIAGTLTLSAAARISGLKITNLTITGSGNTYISNCTVDTQVIKSGTNYVEIINTELQCVSGVQITGAGTVSIVGNKCWAVAVSNASANVLIKDCFQVLTPSVTAGTLQIDGSAIFAISPASNAVTSSVGSFITLANCFVLNSAGTNVERVSLAGFYSILNLVYDKTNSTFAGTNLNAIDYFSVINADTLVLTNDLAIAYGGTNSSATPTAGGAAYGTGTAYAFTAAGTAGQVLTSAGAGAPVWSGISGGTF